MKTLLNHHPDSVTAPNITSLGSKLRKNSGCHPQEQHSFPEKKLESDASLVLRFHEKTPVATHLRQATAAQLGEFARGDGSLVSMANVWIDAIFMDVCMDL